MITLVFVLALTDTNNAAVVAFFVSGTHKNGSGLVGDKTEYYRF